MFVENLKKHSAGNLQRISRFIHILIDAEELNRLGVCGMESPIFPLRNLLKISVETLKSAGFDRVESGNFVKIINQIANGDLTVELIRYEPYFDKGYKSDFLMENIKEDQLKRASLVRLSEQAKSLGVSERELHDNLIFRFSGINPFRSLQGICKEISEIDHEFRFKSIPTASKPYCTVKNGVGYFILGKNGEEIRIGKPSSQPYKLMMCLTEPFGVGKSINTVYEALRDGNKVKPRGIYTASLDRNAKLRIIKISVIKEIQKGGKISGKINFKFDDLNTKLWLELIS